MFDVYENAEQQHSVRRFAVAGLLAVATCVAIAFGVTAFGGSAPSVIKEAKVDVIFRQPVEAMSEVKTAPVPPPPAPVKVVRRAVAPAPKVQAVRAVEPAALVAPKEVPVEKPPETDAAQAVAEAPVAVGGTGALVQGALAGIGSGQRGEEPVSAATRGRAAPMNLPEDATPPVDDPSNAAPAYPDDARGKGVEGLVILKVVVEADGSVGAIKVMKGDEPFVASALRAVKSWRYQPAVVEGRPAAVYRIVKIPFRIKN